MFFGDLSLSLLELVVVSSQTLLQFRHRHVQSRLIHHSSRNRPIRKTRRQRQRSLKPSKNQLREHIPFLDHLKESQHPDQYLSIFQDYHQIGHAHGYPSYASLIYKLAKARKFEDVDAVLGILKTHDVKCGEALFVGLMRHYGKCGMVEKAFDLFCEMGRSFNCGRSVQSFNTILNVLVDNGRVDEPIKLFAEGFKMRFRLNSVSFNVMIKMWLKRGEWDRAIKVFNEMLERGVEPTVVTYNLKIGFLCRTGAVDKAKRLFEDMRRKGRRGNAVTYALLMEGLCGLGKFDEAKKVMFDMEYHGCKVELVNLGVLISHLSKRGLIDEAKALLAEMKKRRITPDVVIYNIFIEYYCRKVVPLEGYKILVDMQVKGCAPNAASYRMVVDGFCKAENFTGALKVLNAMLHSKHCPRVETFQGLCVALARSGNLDDAGFVLEEMTKRGISLDSDSLETLVREHCTNSDPVSDQLADIIYTHS